MRSQPSISAAAALAIAGLVVLTWTSPAAAHCDSVDGPVAADVRAAVAAGDPTPILKWVPAADEDAVRDAFAHAAEVRDLGEAGRELADRWLLETVVRIHRAGEGAPFTGIKPAGSIDPGIQLADRALEAGSPDALAAAVTGHVERVVRERFTRVLTARKAASDSVDKGRAYVAAYVELMHTIEGLHHALADGHGHDQ